MDSCAFKSKSVLLASTSCTASSRPASVRKPRRELKQFMPEAEHPLWRIKITHCGESRSPIVKNQEANNKNQTVKNHEPSDENHNLLKASCGMSNRNELQKSNCGEPRSK